MVVSRLTRGNLRFVAGLVVGFALSYVVLFHQQVTQGGAGARPQPDLPQHLRLELHGGHGPEADVHMAFDDLVPHHHHSHNDTLHGQPAKAVKFEDLHVHHDDDTIAKEMSKKVRVLVWVMTGPQNLDKKAVHVRNTWGRRANKLLFMSSQWNASFPTVGLNVSEGREHLTGKTMQAFRYVYQHHFNDADWFMKADDDTYVIMENLRYMLSSHDTDKPIYFGHIFKVIVKPDGYASGGAGYVLSREALRRLATRGTDTKVCRQDGGAEDVEVGKCLRNLGVRILPSTDVLGRSRFHCFGPEAHLQGGYPVWYLKYDAYGAKKGMDNISDYPITFHYINPARMYALEYFIYHLRPYGIISRDQDLNLNDKQT